MNKTYDYDAVMAHCKGSLNDACVRLQGDLKKLREQIEALEEHYHGKEAGSTVKKSYDTMLSAIGGAVANAPANAGQGFWNACKNSADLITTMFAYAEIDKNVDQGNQAKQRFF